MASQSYSAFSPDSKYFASCEGDGKLRIWQTHKNVLFQEYTPNFHLNAPCSCLRWISSSGNPGESDTGGPSRKKKRKVQDVGTDIIAIGTSNGKILLYSLASAKVEGQLEGGHKSFSITGLSWCPGTNLYSCGDCTIAEWNISEKKPKRKWNAGTDRLSSVAVSPDGKHVLSASRSIKLWNAVSHELVTTFTGHASAILSLTFVPKPAPNGSYYFVSTAKGDRYINVWSLSKGSEKSSVVSMVLESEPAGAVSLYEAQDNGTISLSAVTQSGVVQMFLHQLNGRCPKPLKPTLTVQVATDSSRGVESVEPIPIVSALCSFKEEVRIAYGVGTFLAFENVVLNYSEKLQVLVRQDPRRMHLESTSDSSQTKLPDIQKAHYLPPSAANAVVSGVKRGSNRRAEVPMEERLENLSLTMARAEDRSAGMPRSDNLAQLLLQALMSKDKTMLQTVLLRREEEIIRNTVRRLPIQVLEPLLRELTSLLHGKTATAQIGARWLKVVLSTHSAHLMANPTLVELLSPVIGLIETRLTVLPSLSRLSGRLELLSSQLDGSSGSDDNAAVLDMQSSLLMYQDADTSDEDDEQDDNGVLGSESDDHWEELSEDEDVDSNGDENDEMED